MFNSKQDLTERTIFRLNYGNEEYSYLCADVPGVCNDQPVAKFLKTLDKELIVAVSIIIAESFESEIVINADFHEE